MELSRHQLVTTVRDLTVEGVSGAKEGQLEFPFYPGAQYTQSYQGPLQ